MSFFLLLLSIVAFYFAKSNVTKILFAIYSGSIASSIVIGDTLPYNASTLFYVIFIHSIISILFYSFNNLNSAKIAENNLSKAEIALIKSVIYFAIIGAIANSYIFIKMMSGFASGNVTVEVFKNAEVGLNYFKDLNPFARFISGMFSPLSYLCLAMHFYFMAHRRAALSKLAFYGSLSVIIEQLAFFGRGGIVIYMMIYLLMFSFVFPMLSGIQKKKALIFAFLATLIIAAIFLQIAISRFYDFRHFENQGNINNPVVVSIFSYYSQWISNGYRLFLTFDNELMIHFSNFMYLPNKFLEIVNLPVFDLENAREHAFGDQSTIFNGLPALLLFDMHYLGAYIFVIIYFAAFRYYTGSWKSKKIKIHQFILIALAIPFPAMFFQGIHFVHGGFNISIIYFLIFFVLSKVTFVSRINIASRITA